MTAVKQGESWEGYINQAVKEINDDKIYTLFFPYMGLKTHPKIEQHRQMADTLIKFINEHKLLPKE